MSYVVCGTVPVRDSGAAKGSGFRMPEKLTRRRPQVIDLSRESLNPKP